jgi:hypothetical protein
VTADKPTAEELSRQVGVRIDDLPWQTSGHGAGMFQVAIVRPADEPGDVSGDDSSDVSGDDGVWVLVRLEGGADVQVYSRREWEAWLDGARRGEFDDLL